MKQRFRMFRRANGAFYSHDSVTGKQHSLNTPDKIIAKRLLHAKNEAYQQPVINLHIARAYLSVADAQVSKRTWRTPMEEIVKVEVGKIENGTIVLRDGRTLPADYRRFSHGYAVTSHSAQSKTVDEAIVLAGSRSLGAIDNKQFYVSISRGRERCRIFTDDRQMLREWICQDRNRKAAIELLELKRALEKTAVIPARQKIEPPKKSSRVKLIPEFVHRYLQQCKELQLKSERQVASRRITKGVRI